MKNIFILLLSFTLLNSCQNELYKDGIEEFQSDQGIYISTKVLQNFVEEGKETQIKGIRISLVKKAEKDISAPLVIGDENQIAVYNKKNGTSYILLPKEMYETLKSVNFKSQHATLELPLKLKNIKFSTKGTYALPIRIEGGNTKIIEGQNEALIILEQKVVTSSLRLSGYGGEDAKMFPDNFKVDQWTMEVMVNRKNYSSNNRAICGTKMVAGSSNLDEIFTRFGDVTINPNQLQIKTGASQIDIPSDKLSAQPDTWYMLSFVYDGKNTKVYVNGELAAEREIRSGAYGMTGIWFSGRNELVRELRFWNVARSASQIKDVTWKMVNPDAEGLLLYYPMNGKKLDRKTGKIVEDTDKVWDWSKNMKHIDMPKQAIFDNNNGKGFVFPPELK